MKKLLCLFVLSAICMGCGGGSGDPVPPKNPVPPPGEPEAAATSGPGAAKSLPGK